jgi:hypothetical protein
VDTKSCPVCRSVNHTGISRCMNCGAPMELPAVPIGVDLDDLPPAPTPDPNTYGWNGLVATAPKTRRRGSSAAIVFGIVAVISFICGLVIFASYPNMDAPSTLVITVFFALSILSVVFWIWMLVDAISDSRIGWALAIFFFGTIAALLYALFGRSPRTASY